MNTIRIYIRQVVVGSHGGRNLRRSKPNGDPPLYGRAPFGTIKRMSGGGRFLTRGLRRVKAEAALSILAYNILHAVNAFGAHKLTPAR